MEMEPSSMSTAVPRLDILKSRQGCKSANLRNQIVELAGKNSTCEEEVSARSKHFKESENQYSKRSDTTLGFYEDRKQTTTYTQIHRKKDYINLNFTSIKKEAKDDGYPRREFKPRDILAREKPSTILLNRLKSKVGPINEPGDNKTQYEEFKNRRETVDEINFNQHMETRVHPKSAANFRQTTSSCHNNNNDYDIHMPEVKQNDLGKGNVNRHYAKSRNAKQSRRESSEQCEIKGNAVPIPPQYQHSGHTLSSRRAGLFTASLAAFKRRLRVSSKKFTARLHDDNSTKDEDYIIMVDSENTTRNGVKMFPKQPLLSIPDHPFTKSKRVNPRATNVYQDGYGSRIPKFPSTNNVTNVLPNPYSENKLLSNSSKSSDEDGAKGGVDKKPKEPVNYQEALPSVTNAKTYVLEEDQTSAIKSELLEPVPLTSHNLRLHDSILTMRTRRARRLERCRRMNNFNNISSNTAEGGGLSDNPMGEGRIQKWLNNVVMPTPPESGTQETLNNNDLYLLQQCSTETGFDLQQQAYQTVIAV